MKRLLAGTALLACLANPALAATVWQGDLFVSAVNNVNNCNAVNTQVGDFARFNFRPKSVAGNGTTDLLSWTFPRSSGQMTPEGTVLDTATQATVRYIFGSAAFSQISNSPIAATVNPAAPSGSTAVVRITIRIDNIHSSSGSNLSNCNATFSGALSKRPPEP